MRKKLTLLTVAVALTAGAAFVKPASALTCPKGSHLMVCPSGDWCCPNNAFCVCSPF